MRTRIQRMRRTRRIWQMRRTRRIRWTRQIRWTQRIRRTRRIQRIQWIRRFLSFINFATKGFLSSSRDYPLSCTWLNGEPQISRKERYEDIFSGTYSMEYLMIAYFNF